MRKQYRIPLQVKIIALVLILLIFVISFLTVLFALNETKDEVKRAEDLAFQTAKMISYMPSIHKAFLSANPRREIDPIAEQILLQLDADAIWIEERAGDLYGEAGMDRYSETTNKEDRKTSLIFGNSYIRHTSEGDKELLKGIAPILINYGNYGIVEGTVTIVFDMDKIHNSIAADIKKIWKQSAYILLVGAIGSYFFARNIRKDILGLEPFEISALYRERNAILQSVKEGILAIDQYGKITMMNLSAKELLEIPQESEGQFIHETIHSNDLLEVLSSGAEAINKELHYKNKVIIVNSKTISENGEKLGIVVSFRDKTDVKKMVDAFSEVKQYSEDLRAQTHEFKNKLYVILGLIQLDKKEEAIEFINEETNIQEQHFDLFFTNICDNKVQAILLGKLAKASEKKIDFIIDETSSLEELPDHISLSPLIVIIGNLIDNAFEAVTESVIKKVTFFATDIGKDIIFEISDSGNGIEEGMEEFIFKKGVSFKGEKRGYGLTNLKKEVESLGGSIELISGKNNGTVFTIFLPKEL